MLRDLLKRKSHVSQVIEQAQGKVKTLEAEQAEAKGRLWTLQQEQDRVTRTIFDEKARALLAEDRHPIEAEIERLQARRPIVAMEIEELTKEIIPRLEGHLQEAQQAVKAEALALKHKAAVHAAEGREDLLRQWNAAIPNILRVAEAIGTFNGRFDFHQKGYRDASTEQRQPMQPTGEAIPATILHALNTALSEAWRTSYKAGEAEAETNDVRL